MFFKFYEKVHLHQHKFIKQASAFFQVNAITIQAESKIRDKDERQPNHIFSRMLNKINPYQILVLLTVYFIIMDTVIFNWSSLAKSHVCSFVTWDHEAVPGPAVVKSMLNT